MAKARIGQPAQLDDLNVGLCVTVLRSVEPDRDQESESPLRMMVATIGLGGRYDGLKGVPLRIKAMHLPYVIVHCCCDNPRCQVLPIPIDTRAVELTIVGEEYALSMRRTHRTWWEKLIGLHRKVV